MFNHICLCRSNVAIALVTSMTLVGCGGSVEDDRPARVPVSGTVSFKGAPVDGAVVTFRPTSAQGPGASGKTDAEGRFVMSTFEGADGVIPGRYNVGVTKFESVQQAAGAVPSMDDPNYAGEAEIVEKDDDEDSGRRRKGPKNLLPQDFADPDNAALSVEITEATDSVEFSLD